MSVTLAGRAGFETGAKSSVLLVGNFSRDTRATNGVCQDLAARLSGAGWRTLTTSGKRGRLSRLLDVAGAVWRYRDEYAVAQVDVYSGLAFVWAEVACSALRRARKPYLVSLHGGNLPTFADRWPGRVRRLLRSAAVATTPSGYLREKMRPYRADLLLLPNPLDLTAYRYRLRERPQPRLVWLRAFHRVYNPGLAPRVLALLGGGFATGQLTMVGPDKGDGSLQRTQQVAEELGVAGRITLPGGVPRAVVPACLDAGDIFLNTTNVDNTPMSVLEAMASGMCIVSTDVGGMPYLLDDGVDALLTPPDDPEAMASAVRRILTEAGLAGRLSRNARAKAERFAWPVVLPRWESLLAAVAAGSPP
jgi:glycosyltransferase involved in cell wall biosynthesis